MKLHELGDVRRSRGARIGALCLVQPRPRDGAGADEEAFHGRHVRVAQSGVERMAERMKEGQGRATRERLRFDLVNEELSDARPPRFRRHAEAGDANRGHRLPAEIRDNRECSPQPNHAIASGDDAQIRDSSERALQETRPALSCGSTVRVAGDVDLDESIQVIVGRCANRQLHRPRVSKKVHG